MARVAQASIIIDAPVEHVWSVMTDFPRYGDWNPFVPRIEFERAGAALAIGEVVFFFSRWVDTPDGSQRRNRGIIVRVEPPSADSGIATPESAVLEYRFASWPATAGLVNAARRQWLTALPDGRTQYFTHEEFSGLLVALVPLRRVQEGFDANAAALKDRAESTRP